MSEPISVPRWAVVAALAASALLSLGISLGVKAEAQSSFNVTVDYRLCRIEKALNISPWQSCYLETRP